MASKLQPHYSPAIRWRLRPKRFPPQVRSGHRSIRRRPACKVKAFVLSLKGLAQHWYSNLPGGHIHTWDQLRRELTAAFRAPKPEEVNSCAFHNLKQGGSSLQEYLHSLVKLRARALNVDEKTIIDAPITDLSLGPCGEYLEHRRPKTLNRFFEIVQEYCISDKEKHRRIEEMNEQRSHNRDRPKTH